MARSLLRLCAWSGPALVLIMLGALVLMGFVPPLTPDMTADEVAAAFAANRTGIRVGGMLLMQFGLLGVLWSVAIALQIRRIEAPELRVLSSLQMILGVSTFLVFVLAAMMWTVAAFRPERDPELILVLNDLGWLTLLMPVFSGAIQAIVIGLAIFSDAREEPLFPRWAAYFNFWCAVIFLPGALATFFKTGPFAWSGMFDFWLPVLAFAGWLVVMGVLTAKAVDKP